ncbi:hypothetical protein MKZ38_006082 [Zalerion maritima]|uniref:Uncharacterized protein n=1 Tax=Zalerion maritima TaxID=339359 RepID=A0AAD5RWV9_9PEZI|nr:hypothetical protein MKZ38_006082 [Zalerion maritima]
METSPNNIQLPQVHGRSLSSASNATPMHQTEAQQGLQDHSHQPPSTPQGCWDSPGDIFLGALYVLVPWLIGAGCGISHHFMYCQLDGTIIPDSKAKQQGITTAGIILPILAKFSFTQVLHHSYVQHSWRVFRRDAMRFRIINAAFSAPGNIGEFLRLTWSLVRRRRMHLFWVLGVFLWLIRFLPFAPSTALNILDGAGTLVTTDNTSFSVPFLEFQPWVGDNVSAIASKWSPTFYNQSSLLSTVRLRPILEAIASSSAFLGETILHPSPCGSNCTYQITFNAPAYYCLNVPFRDTPWGSDSILRVSWEDGQEGKVGNRTIYASSSSRGKLYLVASHLHDSLRALNPIYEGPGRNIDTAEKVTDSDFVFQAVECSDWNATYVASLSFNSGSTGSGSSASGGTSITILERRLLNVIDYTENPYANGESYVEVNQAIHFLLSSWLTGDMTLNTTFRNNKPSIPSSLILPKTKLVNISEPFGDDEAAYYYAVPDLRSAVQQLHLNVTLSMLSASEHFFFLRKSDGHDVQLLSSVGLYVYDPAWLVGSYIAATGVTLVVFCLGIWAVWVNGVRHADDFGAIVAATRNAELDDLARGDGLGRTPLRSGISDADLMLGSLGSGSVGSSDGPPSSAAPQHVAFGGSVSRFKKGDNYY